MVHDSRHQRFRVLALATVLLGLTPAAFPLSVAGPQALAAAYFGWTVAVYLLAVFGTIIAATSYSPGDPPRPGWASLGAGYVALVASRLVAGPIPNGLYQAPTSWPTTQLVGNVLYELATLAGYLVLTRAWSATGLEAASRTSRVLYRLGALAVAAILVGPEVVDRFPAALQGAPLAIADVVTDLLDAAVLVVATPVLRAALTLGGGLVSWPWFLLTMSVLGWLGYDAAAWGTSLGLSPEFSRQLQEAARSLATVSIFSAGVAQRWVMLLRTAPRR
jgi:hypothetical protein